LQTTRSVDGAIVQFRITSAPLYNLTKGALVQA